MTPLLLPLSYIYGAMTDIRNWMFDHHILASEQFDTPVVVVGNLTVGGTGKTPHTEWLIHHLLEHKKKIAVLSRGYGRSTKGFRWVTPESSASEVGDEPLQIRRKFDSPDLLCAVCEDRRVGIRTLERTASSIELVLLDDAFQHRYVNANCYILLTDYHRLYTEDYPFPAGRLREKRSGAQRAHIVVVTKCPMCLSTTERQRITNQLNLNPEQRLFFTTMEHQLPPAKENSLLITGIAHPHNLLQELKDKGYRFHHLAYSDHHRFTTKDRANIIKKAQHYSQILTTEKDFVRLEELRLPQEVWNKIEIVSITPKFLFDAETFFLQTFHNYVIKNHSNSNLD